MSKPIREPIFWKDLISGYVCGVANICVGQPFDICKVRIQSRGQGSFGGTFLEIVRNEGVFSLWKGSPFPLIFFGLCSSVLFAVNEDAKYRLRLLRAGSAVDAEHTRLNFVEFFLAGSLAGVANTIISSPMEHIRIRMQTQPHN